MIVEEPARWRWSLGSSTRAPGAGSFLRARRVFVALVGVTYFAAFLSFGHQIIGLIGEQGILPANDFLAAARERLGAGAWLHYPTLLHLGCSDTALLGFCAVGLSASIALIFGLAPRLVLFALWALYLSLTVAGNVFFSFQWDNLLLETGLLAIFFAPRGSWPARWDEPASRAALFLLRFLLFKLMFLSGITKLISEDPSWASLSALDYHFWTQPLPSWLSVYAAELPSRVLTAMTAVMFAIELVLPFFVFGPRVLRLIAAAGLVALQLAILTTGNYGFFNLLTIALCVPLLDDRVFERMLRLRLPIPAQPPRPGWPAWRAALSVGAVSLFALSAASTLPDLLPGRPLPPAVEATLARTSAWRSISGYGLFRTMTTDRIELVIEGSADGESWQPYEFRHKPGRTDRAPGIVGFHMPRLDWQMWFQPLRREPSTWFLSLQRRLLEAAPPVLALFDTDPFDGRRPRFVRTRAYRYRFADARALARGEWWQRTDLGAYTPPLQLRDDRLVVAW